MATVDRTEGDAVAVLAWDAAHNALVRAWMLAEAVRRGGREVRVAGPMLAEREVWLPLRDAQPPIDTLKYASWRDLVREIAAYVESHPHRTVIVSKPRFPSMLMGLEYKRRWGARVIVDIDDWELALVGRTEGLDAARVADLPPKALWVGPAHPFWTRIADGMLGLADAVTVSNPMLQRRFGGTIVRHARDERLFDACRFDAGAMRQRYGLPAGKRIVMFLGTPRRHKGLREVVSFIEASGSRDLVLCVIDSIRDAQFRAALVAAAGDRLMFVAPVPYAEVPGLLSTADFVCLALDLDSDVSEHQVPAKITDAIAMRVPVLMAASPSVADLFERRIFVNEGPLNAEAFARGVNASPQELAEVTERAHEVFLREFSLAAVARTLTECLRTAGNKPLPDWSPHVFALTRRMLREGGE